MSGKVRIAGRWTRLMGWQTASWPALSHETESENRAKVWLCSTALERHSRFQKFLLPVPTS